MNTGKLQVYRILWRSFDYDLWSVAYDCLLTWQLEAPVVFCALISLGNHRFFFFLTHLCLFFPCLKKLGWLNTLIIEAEPKVSPNPISWTDVSTETLQIHSMLITRFLCSPENWSSFRGRGRKEEENKETVKYPYELKHNQLAFL